jgi:hypothetical protein
VVLSKVVGPSPELRVASLPVSFFLPHSVLLNAVFSK